LLTVKFPTIPQFVDLLKPTSCSTAREFTNSGQCEDNLSKSMDHVCELNNDYDTVSQYNFK